jgi:hypothetical protein
VQPADASVSASATFAPPTEVVHRPEAGTLARGAWEAPSWFFYGTAALVVVAATFYALARLGLISRLVPWRRRERRARAPKA